MMQLNSLRLNVRYGWIACSLGLVMGLFLSLFPAAWAIAATLGTLTRQSATEVTVSLGTQANELKFVPNELQLTSGKRYKLVLNNPSPQKHYFTAKDFADAIWTQKVEAGRVEIKGAIHEVELKPEATAEWVFIPIKAGTYTLRCPISGHTEAGMTGTIQITEQA